MFLKLTFQYLIFLSEKIIETITVHENGCNNVLLWYVETNAWINFRRKLFLLKKKQSKTNKKKQQQQRQ